MSVSPEGTLFVAERGADRVVALPDADDDGTADEVVQVGAGYVPLTTSSSPTTGPCRWPERRPCTRVTLDGLVETDRRILVGGLPGGGHATKTVEITADGAILLSIGSSCDACDEADDRRVNIQRLTADGPQPHMVGLRNAVGLWVDDATGRAWATNMGRDRLGDGLPPKTLYEVVAGADAGWPRCHAGTLPDPEFGTDGDACTDVAQPAATFPAHMAPLALVA